MGVFLDAGLSFQSSFRVATNKQQGTFFSHPMITASFRRAGFVCPLDGAVTCTAK